MLIFGRFTTAVDLFASVGMSQAHLLAREGNPASDVCNIERFGGCHDL